MVLVVLLMVLMVLVVLVILVALVVLGSWEILDQSEGASAVIRVQS